MNMHDLGFGALLRRAGLTGPQGMPRGGPSEAAIDKALADLRVHGRHAIRILDLDCGDDTRLLRAARQARALGFTAIEGCGAGLWTAGIRHARWQAGLEAHPSTGLVFRIAEPIGALASEHDSAADLILLSEPMPYPASPLAAALARVGSGVVLASV